MCGGVMCVEGVICVCGGDVCVEGVMVVCVEGG